MPRARTDDGLELHYHIDDFRAPWSRDTDEAVLMHHGFARNMKWWTQWVPHLARKYKVLRYDCRGCGHSGVPPEGAAWSADRLVKDALNLIDHLGIGRVHWVGFESGGVFGMAFAVSHPTRVRSLTLVNTPSERWIGDRMTTAMRGNYDKVSEAIDRLGLRQWLTDTMPNRIDMDRATPELVHWHIAEHSRTPTHVAKAIMQVVEGADVAALAPRIQAPTLIMTGERSPNCPPEEQRALARRIPKARDVVVFPNIGVGIQLLIPDKCVAELLGFLETV